MSALLSKKLMDEIALSEINYKFIRIKYTIERRVFKDVFYYNGWWRNMTPDWSEWKPIRSYNDVSVAKKVYDLFERRKPFKMLKTEYRMVKEK